MMPRRGLSMTLPYDDVTPVWWHDGDEKFYETSDEGRADYVLVPKKMWDDLTTVDGETVDGEG